MGKKNNTCILKVENLDPLGQGVSKGKEITFTKKVLPGEEIEVFIHKKRKGVQFAQLRKIIKPSEHRITPACSHYNSCLGCDYLHTSYENEIQFKEKSLAWYLRLLTQKKIDVYPAQERFGYRNRIQLHYNKTHLGFINQYQNEIVNVPHCLLPKTEAKTAIEKLYENQDWRKTTSKTEGHVEIYVKNGKCEMTWDKPYANEGFSQVNNEMNEVMTNYLKQVCDGIGASSLKTLELFAGEGNLTKKLNFKNITMIDFYTTAKDNPQFVTMDLYQSEAAKLFKKRMKHGYELLILDPPRAGLKNLNEWTQLTSCEHVIYVSCYPATLLRDLKALPEEFKIEQIALFDMFPGTQHYESLVYLKRMKKLP